MKNLKNSLVSFLYLTIILLVRLIPVRRYEKKLLLLKTDEIGDYVLFHSYLKFLKMSEKYRNYKIILLGNKAWEDIHYEYEANCGISEVVWLDKRLFKRNLLYRFSISLKIRRLGVSDTINCIFSRSLLLDDGFAFLSTAASKVAMTGDDTNRIFERKNLDRYIYSEIIDAGDVGEFDAVRNRNFISSILKKADISVETAFNTIRALKSERYFVLFLGAGNPERNWPAPFFAELASYISSHYGILPVICGGRDNYKEETVFFENYRGKARSVVGKTSLLDMFEILSGSEFLVSVDTGILHIAAAVACPVIGLYSGKFFGRFAPYPNSVASKFWAVYPDFVDDLIASGDPMLYNTSVMKNDTIKLISVNKVRRKIDEVLCTNEREEK